jgi:glycine cleavage system pyridoxal-binding protein P
MDENRDNQVNRDVVDTTMEPETEQRAQTEAQPMETRTAASTNDELQEMEALFEQEESEKFRTQWLNIQGKFVDNPRESVREADELVASVLKSVTMGFHNRRTSLEKQWNSGSNISTEDLRLALKRYRSFFDRLLTLES